MKKKLAALLTLLSLNTINLYAGGILEPSHTFHKRGYYIELQAGVNFPNWSGNPENVIPLQNGYNGAFSFGYFNPTFHMRYAIEINNMYNTVNLPATLRFANQSEQGYGLYQISGSGSINTLSVMANLAYDIDYLIDHMNFYLGVGAGLFYPITNGKVSCTPLDKEPELNDCNGKFNQLTYSAFGYQIIAGARYWLTEKSAIGIDYHFIGSNSTQNCLITDGCLDGSYNDYHHQINISWLYLFKSATTK